MTTAAHVRGKQVVVRSGQGTTTATTRYFNAATTSGTPVMLRDRQGGRPDLRLERRRPWLQELLTPQKGLNLGSELLRGLDAAHMSDLRQNNQARGRNCRVKGGGDISRRANVVLAAENDRGHVDER